jgi:hypothetical protein
MIKDEKHKQLRQLLIDKVLETKSPDKPSKSRLQKMSDEDLVYQLFVNSVLAERQFWKDDIRNAALKINPEQEFSTDLKNNGLINRLIELVEKSKMK